MLKLENGTNSFYQWDLDQRLIVTEIDGPASVHFWQEGLTEALVVQPYKEGDKIMVDVPNILLQKAAPLSAYIYREDVGKYTSYKWIFQAIPREKPADYIYTETEVKTWQQLYDKMDEIDQKYGNVEAALDELHAYAQALINGGEA